MRRGALCRAPMPRTLLQVCHTRAVALLNTKATIILTTASFSADRPFSTRLPPPTFIVYRLILFHPPPTTEFICPFATFMMLPPLFRSCRLPRALLRAAYFCFELRRYFRQKLLFRCQLQECYFMPSRQLSQPPVIYHATYAARCQRLRCAMMMPFPPVYELSR